MKNGARFTAHQLGTFLYSDDCYNYYSILLKGLDGKDNCIQQALSTGKNLGVVLEKMARYKDVPYSQHPIFTATERELRDNTLEKWQQLLRYLIPTWKQNIVEDSAELNALLSQLDAQPNTLKKAKKVTLFLENFLDANNFSDLNCLIAVLTTPTPLSFIQSLAFIQHFHKKKLAEIIFYDKKFEDVLQTIDQHKDKPCYKALLFATTAACQHIREMDDTIYLTYWEQFWDYSYDVQLTAASRLMTAIENHQEVPKVKGVNYGQLGQLSTRYASALLPPVVHPTLS